MNANSVLNRIVTLLTKEEVKMTYAKLEDGTVVESPTFDIGEPVEIVTEEGKSPAPNGEHDLFLRDEEGNEVHIRVITEEGIIVERENVEELEEETKEEEDIKEEKMSEDTLEVEPLPGEEDSEMTALEEVGKKMEEMAYRIEELEKTISKMQEETEEVDEESEEMEEEEEVSPMNGAPVEMKSVSVKLNKSKSIANTQASFLAKLYN